MEQPKQPEITRYDFLCKFKHLVESRIKKLQEEKDSALSDWHIRWIESMIRINKDWLSTIEKHLKVVR